MTVAQLVEYPGAVARHIMPRLAVPKRRVGLAACPTDAELWRGIAAGFLLAIVALLLMTLAIGAAGVRAPTPAQHVSAAAGPAPNRLEIYQPQDAGGAWAMPVP